MWKFDFDFFRDTVFTGTRASPQATKMIENAALAWIDRKQSYLLIPWSGRHDEK
jgi:hypothetical protein